MLAPEAPNFPRKSKPGIQVRDTRTGIVYPSISQAARALCVSTTTIEMWAKRRLKKPKIDLSFLEFTHPLAT